MRPVFVLFATLMLVVTLSSASMADKVRMKNGDVLTGTVQSMEGGTLHFKTPYAGTLKISWDQVDSLATDKPMTMFLGKGVHAQTSNELAQGGKTVVLRDGQDQEVETSGIKAVNRDPDRVKYKANANVGWYMSEGNTRENNIHADAGLTVDFDMNRFILYGEVNNKEKNSSRTKEDWLVSLEYDRFIDKKFYWWVKNVDNHDKFKDLDLRVSIGTGPGYQFFKSEDLNLFVSAGPAYVWENYIDKDDLDFAAGQWNVNFDWWLWKDRVQLFHRQVGLLSTENVKNLILQTWQGLRFPIVDAFYATMQYNLTYDGTAHPGKDQMDQEWVFSLGYSLQN